MNSDHFTLSSEFSDSFIMHNNNKKRCKWVWKFNFYSIIMSYKIHQFSNTWRFSFTFSAIVERVRAVRKYMRGLFLLQGHEFTIWSTCASGEPIMLLLRRSFQNISSSHFPFSSLSYDCYSWGFLNYKLCFLPHYSETKYAQLAVSLYVGNTGVKGDCILWNLYN